MNVWIKNFILLVLMLAASGLALALRPTYKVATYEPAIDLEAIIPRAFGEWHAEKENPVPMVDPQQQEMIEKIYTQTLNRTYVNNHGYRIMLAIAYGDDQRDAMQLHYPEVCYPAQGFSLTGKEKGTLTTENGSIPVTRILTNLGQRNEPVTYWTTVGDKVFQGGIEKKLVEIGYGLNGKIPDGLLIRVSSIDPEASHAFAVQARFADQMLGALTPKYRQKLNGNL
ncbi:MULTISPECIES: exosortase-associated protein EpsI, B-type [unclassified Nitrosospira]|uniref:exosortase-associated protein EpsI, B-type n=1 Tax=unclassified Nitrosospira TaxID=2609267 RepID=UPI000D2FEF41|nr:MULTISPECIES: exosortase-associated protein EpsI, B-type [unclassified Nitrosospira]PTR15090.1 EpsI family protein [Nitrosospira sp. Nsp2]WON72606.1 EpsI family protein [Nitrosospira sp. Is2]